MKLHIITTCEQERHVLYRLFKFLSFIPRLFAWFKYQQAIKYNTIRQQRAPHTWVEAPDLRIEFNPLRINKYSHVNICPLCGCITSVRVSKRWYLAHTETRMHYQQPMIVNHYYYAIYWYTTHTRVLCSKDCERMWACREEEGKRIQALIDEAERNASCIEMKCENCSYNDRC